MSRNIWLTFEEWSAIKEEVNPEKWWSYHLSARELNEWKSDIKNGYGDQKCFKRAGVNTNILNKITTPYFSIVCCKKIIVMVILHSVKCLLMRIPLMSGMNHV